VQNILTIEKHFPQNDEAALATFARQYLLLRKKENRIYTDNELLLLPDTAPSHQYYKEWQVRKKSCRRLLQCLAQKKSPLQILEVGCGNGWLSAQLASLKNTTVTGIDINTAELQQAQRAFAGYSNLQFINATLNSSLLNEKVFDIIIFAASVQYFPSVKKVIKAAMQHLTLQGEIHITDSPFYRQQEMASARQRTKEYFKSVNFPKMAHYYFHHSIDTLHPFTHQILYNPKSLVNRLRKNKNPFYHIVITAPHQ